MVTEGPSLGLWLGWSRGQVGEGEGAQMLSAIEAVTSMSQWQLAMFNAQIH